MPALYSHTTRASGIVLTAAIYNADHENHITNGVPLQLDDYSSDATEMRVTTDPGESGTESLATTLGGELARLRFTIKEMKKWLNGGVDVAQWYTTASGSVSGTVADSSITMAKLADIAGLSIIGRPSNTTGVPSAFDAGSDGDVLRRLGTTLGFGTILSTSVSDLGTAATANTGTSGNTIPKNNSANVFSARQSLQALLLTPQESSSGGAQNSFNLNSSALTFTGSAVTLGGMTGGANGGIVLIYYSGTEITIDVENGAATAANRFRTPGSTNIVLDDNGEMALAIYSTILSRWLVSKLQ